MNIPLFDDLSRLAARGELSKSLTRSLKVGLQGLLAAVGMKAHAQPVPSFCDVATLDTCLMQAKASGKARLSACMTGCLAQTDPTLMSLECAACIDSLAATMGTEIRSCHSNACGGRSGEYCSRFEMGYAPDSIWLSVCCPLGSSFRYAAYRGQWGCYGGCGFGGCAYPYVLDPEYCVCVCDSQLGVCP
jgi:hypothetical protein